MKKRHKYEKASAKLSSSNQQNAANAEDSSVQMIPAGATREQEVQNLTERSFPPELLRGSPEERLSYFRNFTVAHPVLVAALDAIWEKLHDLEDNPTIFVIGPTGVGKTMLRAMLEKSLREENPTPGLNGEQLPFVSVEVLAYLEEKEGIRSLYRRIFVALGNSFLEKVHSKEGTTSGTNEIENFFRVDSRLTGERLRDKVIEGFRRFSPIALILDDAHSLLGGHLAGCRIQMDVLNEIAALTGVVPILIGNYGLNRLLDIHQHLLWRSLVIHFHAYTSDAEDYSIFESIIYSFQENLPFQEEPDLLEFAEYLYERSIGCAGILSRWLIRSCKLALTDSKRKPLELPQLKACVPINAHVAASMRQHIERDAAWLNELTSDKKLIDELRIARLRPWRKVTAI